MFKYSRCAVAMSRIATSLTRSLVAMIWIASLLTRSLTRRGRGSWNELPDLDFLTTTPTTATTWLLLPGEVRRVYAVIWSFPSNPLLPLQYCSKSTGLNDRAQF